MLPQIACYRDECRIGEFAVETFVTRGRVRLQPRIVLGGLSARTMIVHRVYAEYAIHIRDGKSLVVIKVEAGTFKVTAVRNAKVTTEKRKISIEFPDGVTVDVFWPMMLIEVFQTRASEDGGYEWYHVASIVIEAEETRGDELD